MIDPTDIRPADNTSREDNTSPEYEAARKRVERKRKFRADLVAYVVINTGLIITWAITGGGYFWPAWVLAGWGVGLALDAWNVFFQHPITPGEIEREMDRSR